MDLGFPLLPEDNVELPNRTAARNRLGKQSRPARGSPANHP